MEAKVFIPQERFSESTLDQWRNYFKRRDPDSLRAHENIDEIIELAKEGLLARKGSRQDDKEKLAAVLESMAKQIRSDISDAVRVYAV